MQLGQAETQVDSPSIEFFTLRELLVLRDCPRKPAETSTSPTPGSWLVPEGRCCPRLSMRGHSPAIQPRCAVPCLCGRAALELEEQAQRLRWMPRWNDGAGDVEIVEAPPPPTHQQVYLIPAAWAAGRQRSFRFLQN